MIKGNAEHYSNGERRKGGKGRILYNEEGLK